MKRLIYMIAALALIAASLPAQAQKNKRFYINAGWMLNGTVDNRFVQSFQGYGFYMQNGFYVTPMVAVGGFSSFCTNNAYFPEKTVVLDDGSSLTTSHNRSLYQTPFGSSVRVRFNRGMFQPYAEAKIGTEYSTQSIYYSTFIQRESGWGFYVSPEVGMLVYPFEPHDFGFHLAAYFAYSTNRNDPFGMNGIDNIGFKLGIAF